MTSTDVPCRRFLWLHQVPHQRLCQTHSFSTVMEQRSRRNIVSSGTELITPTRGKTRTRLLETRYSSHIIARRTPIASHRPTEQFWGIVCHSTGVVARARSFTTI